MLNDTCQVLVNGKPFEVVLRDPKRLRKGSGSAEDSAGPMSVSTPMPGKVVKLLVQVGTAVQEGQGVVVVEAMKMQNELKAPKSGRGGENPGRGESTSECRGEPADREVGIASGKPQADLYHGDNDKLFVIGYRLFAIESRRVPSSNSK